MAVVHVSNAGGGWAPECGISGSWAHACSLGRCATAAAQDGKRRQQQKFCSTWYMPESASKSCCNRGNRAEIKHVGGNIFARLLHGSGI